MSPALFYTLIIQPNLNDIAAGYNGNYLGGLQEFSIMPNVSLANGQPLIDVTRKRNILQRKDRSCNTNWSKVGATTNRRITVQELYAAVKNCQEEFYDGCWKDFRDKSPVFQQMITQIMREAVGMDMITNAYFGDVKREAIEDFSVNMYDGVVTKVGNYIDEGMIPAGQHFTLPDGAMTPTEAYDNLKQLVMKRPDVMKLRPPLEQGIYIDYEWAYQYAEYLKSTQMNTPTAIGLIQNGVPVMNFDGYPIFVEPSWTPVLGALNGGTMAHMGYMTMRRNMVFGTNSKYGGGPNMDRAYRIWYSEDEDVWKEKMDMVAGTDILAPSMLVFSMTDIS